MSRRDIVVAEQEEIKVYVSEAGYVCISQIDWEGVDHVISISPMHVPAIMKALNLKVSDAMKSRDLWVQEGDDENS